MYCIEQTVKSSCGFCGKHHGTFKSIGEACFIYFYTHPSCFFDIGQIQNTFLKIDQVNKSFKAAKNIHGRKAQYDNANPIDLG